MKKPIIPITAASFLNIVARGEKAIAVIPYRYKPQFTKHGGVITDNVCYDSACRFDSKRYAGHNSDLKDYLYDDGYSNYTFYKLIDMVISMKD